MLLRPLAWSLSLHVLVLGALMPVPESVPNSVAPVAPLHALLRSAPAPSVPQLADAAAPVPKPKSAPAVMASRHPASVAPAAAALPAPSFEAVAAERVAAAAAGDIPRPQPQAESATEATEVSVAVTPPVPERGPDAAGLRQYRLALAGEARRYRRYPETARREGQTGTAEVRVTVEAAGAMRQAELSRSSGHALLDAAALEMLREAASHAVLPESLRGRRFAVLLPVVFEVEE